MKVNPPWNRNGEFVTYYRGDNLKINNSFFKLMSQKIVFNKELRINGNVVEKCCFEIILVNRKFLIVLDNERFYEIIEDDEDKIYILLAHSAVFVSNRFSDNNKYNIQGRIFLKCTYSDEAVFDEEFDYQLVLSNQKFIIEMLQNINV